MVVVEDRRLQENTMKKPHTRNSHSVMTAIEIRELPSPVKRDYQFTY